MFSKFGQIMGLLIVAGSLQISAFAGGGLMGKLRTRNNKPVLVNLNKATSGTTILSGSRIQCPEKIGATVDLWPLGRLDIAPKADLTLNFAPGEIKVQLNSGNDVRRNRFRDRPVETIKCRRQNQGRGRTRNIRISGRRRGRTRRGRNGWRRRRGSRRSRRRDCGHKWTW